MENNKPQQADEEKEYLDLTPKETKLGKAKKEVKEITDNLFGIQQAPLIPGLMTLDLSGDMDVFDEGLLMENL